MKEMEEAPCRSTYTEAKARQPHRRGAPPSEPLTWLQERSSSSSRVSPASEARPQSVISGASGRWSRVRPVSPASAPTTPFVTLEVARIRRACRPRSWGRCNDRGFSSCPGLVEMERARTEARRPKCLREGPRAAGPVSTDSRCSWVSVHSVSSSTSGVVPRTSRSFSSTSCRQ